MSKEERRLPLGAIRTSNGEVVVPASRRADGSTRKPIRIRHGYVPQDEVPKYKTVGQRHREQEVKLSANSGDAAVDELPMDSLSLEQKREAPAAKERPCSSDRTLQQQRETRRPLVKEKGIATETGGVGEESTRERQQQLKSQLTKIKKQLKEIAKLENMEIASLSNQQKQKIARKTRLQQQRNEAIAELNGATVLRSSSSATGSRPKIAISL